MTAFTVQIDPVAIAPDRTMLDLNSGPISVGTQGGSGGALDWAQATTTTYETQQGIWGNSVADFIVPNRTLTINLLLGGNGYTVDDEETARSQLQQKVQLLQREGGQLLRQRDGGPAMYADIVTASLTIPDEWGETGGVEPDVVLTLEVLPDWYGDEITLTTLAGSSYCSGVLQESGSQAVIEGDYPARCRMVVTDSSGNNQNSMLWGFRSRYYNAGDATYTAALVYEAEAMTPIGGASVVTLSGASGGQVVEQPSLPAGSWVSILSTDITGLSGFPTALSHLGSYRVYARVYTTATDMQLRFLWASGSLAVPVENDAVSIPGAAAFYLVDLGPVRLDSAPIGTTVWNGVIQAFAVGGGEVCVDQVFFQPLDEAAGELVYTNVLSPTDIVTPSTAPSSVTNGSGSSPAVPWTSPASLEDNAGSTSVIITPQSGGNTSYMLLCEGFGFAIPTSCTILGIEVQIDMGGVVTYSGATDQVVELLKAGSAVGSSRATYTAVSTPAAPGQSTNAWRTYGGPEDLWGTTWTPAQINASTFGVELLAGAAPSQAAAMDVSGVLIIVYYTYGGFTIATDAVTYADGATEVRYDGMYRAGPSSSQYGPVSKVTGDLARLPPSGIENRAVQVFVKPSRGDLATLPDSGLDAFTVEVKYRPCWLSRP